MPNEPKILFTRQGREEFIKKYSRPYISCSNGFLERTEGIPVTDEEAIDLLIDQRVREATKNTGAGNVRFVSSLAPGLD